MPKRPMIISISAVSGGGKTTITNQLINCLDNSTSLHFDDYEFTDCPEDIPNWVEEGADYNAWNLTPLVQDIQYNLQNHAHLNYIFIDYPFAYKNSAMANYIDLAIYIDTPLDIAMARRILRDFKGGPLENLQNNLRNYLSCGRKAYLEMENTIKPNSDLVIDGSLETADIVDKIIEEIKNNKKTIKF